MLTIPNNTMDINIYLNAIENYNHSFIESFKNTSCFLKENGLILASKTEKVSNVLSSYSIVNILNGKLENPFLITSNSYPSKTAKPKDMMLLYCISRWYNCSIACFSIRSKPVMVNPPRQYNSRTPVFAVLKHVDSFL
jgi:hypothetical protein